MPKEVITHAGYKQKLFKTVVLFVVALLITGVDQLFKYFVLAYLTPAVPKQIFPGFNLTLTHNTGIAFGLLHSSNGLVQLILIGIVIAVILLLSVTLYKSFISEKGAALALTLVLGGAMGNLIDRLSRGYVVDFVDWYIGDLHWFTFNIADAAICIGAFLLFVVLYRSRG
ncbi:MAG TPA: signal peptidase II [Gammaproteobacteria bacterium]|nr:signal peptidase II [Gammaproteobacteria bacterium]